MIQNPDAADAEKKSFSLPAWHGMGAMLWLFFLCVFIVLLGIAGPSFSGFLDIFDLLILAIATYKVSTIIAGTASIALFQMASGKSTFSFPFGVAPWCALIFVFAFLFMPYVTRLIADIFVVLTLAEFLHAAYFVLWNPEKHNTKAHTI